MSIIDRSVPPPSRHVKPVTSITTSDILQKSLPDSPSHGGLQVRPPQWSTNGQTPLALSCPSRGSSACFRREPEAASDPAWSQSDCTFGVEHTGMTDPRRTGPRHRRRCAPGACPGCHLQARTCLTKSGTPHASLCSRVAWPATCGTGPWYSGSFVRRRGARPSFAREAR